MNNLFIIYGNNQREIVRANYLKIHTKADNGQINCAGVNMYVKNFTDHVTEKFQACDTRTDRFTAGSGWSLFPETTGKKKGCF